MLKTQLKFIITILLVLGLSISLQSLLASWQGPTEAPPGGNIDKPINTGFTAQTKSGALTVVGDMNIASDAFVVGDVIVDGNIGIGVSNPTSKLDISGDISATGDIKGSNLCIGADCKSSWPGGGLGVGQTWQNVKATRASNATYTNSTGKPIMVMVSLFNITGNLRMYSYVGQVTADMQISYTGGDSQSFIVPDGWKYKVYSSTGSFTTWNELR